MDDKACHDWSERGGDHLFASIDRSRGLVPAATATRALVDANRSSWRVMVDGVGAVEKIARAPFQKAASHGAREGDH